MQTEATLADLRPIAKWLIDDAGEAFSTASQWEWFRRQNLAELVEREALIVGTGRRQDWATGNTTAVVRDILLRKSKETVQARIQKAHTGGVAA